MVITWHLGVRGANVVGENMEEMPVFADMALMMWQSANVTVGLT